MSFESFYGGRSGAPFIIVAHFDAINVPDDEEDLKHWKQKFLASNGDKSNLIYKLDSNGNFIEQTAENYDSYSWTHTVLDGTSVNVESGGTKNKPREKANGMVQCFKKGGETTDEVNYGEYVIIDTCIGYSNKSHPDNGKVYRRGMDYDNDMGGAEYIGQIIGPQGNAPKLEMEVISEGMETDSYTVGNGSLVPGKSGNTFNDSIQYGYGTIMDDAGNITGARIGFKFPYLVLEETANLRSAYYQAGDTIPQGSTKTVGDIIDDNFELVNIEDDGSHPFYKRWKINIPKGIKGDAFNDLEIYPTVAKQGTTKYNSSGIATGVVSSDSPLDYLNTAEGQATTAYCHISNTAGDYIKVEDGSTLHFRYKVYNYDNKQNGVFTYIDGGACNTLTNAEIETGTEEGQGNQQVWIEFDKNSNTKKYIGKPLNYIIDTYVVPKYNENDEYDVLDGHLLVYYSDPIRRAASTIPSKSYPSKKLNKKVTGWVDLGSIKGSSDSPLTITEYSDWATLKAAVQDANDPTKDYPPEVLMGTVANPDYKYGGWGIRYTISGVLYCAQYDYKQTRTWTQGFPYASGGGGLPHDIIRWDTDADLLKEGGFTVGTGVRRVAGEDISSSAKNQKDISTSLTKKGSAKTRNFGTDVRYIGAQRNSNNYNLEEQLIMGTDNHTDVVYTAVSGQPNRIKETTTTKYYTGNRTNNPQNCYIITKEEERDKTLRYDSTNKKLYINLKPHVYSHNETLTFKTASDTISVSTKNETYDYNTANTVKLDSQITGSF